MRAGARLGVALEAEGRHVGAGDALQAAVEQRTCVTRRLAGSVSSSTAKPWFWLVIITRRCRGPCTGWLAPWWPNFIFMVFAPGQAQQLVAEADAESRDAARQDLADGGDGVIAGLGIARAVGQEHAVGLQRQHLGGDVCAGTTVTRQPRLTSMRRMLRLTPKS
jgi:hypothetical protein